VSAAPVVLFCRDLSASWEEAEPVRHRLVIPASAAEQVDALPVPDVEELDPWEVVYLGGESVEVLDLGTRKRWRIRRAQCGMGLCCCDLQAWPADYAGPVPDPDPFDGWPWWLTSEGWDALDVECGRPVGELGWAELLAAVAEVRGA
jgi:hypothetical protein